MPTIIATPTACVSALNLMLALLLVREFTFDRRTGYFNRKFRSIHLPTSSIQRKAAGGVNAKSFPGDYGFDDTF
jgi:hypothetical protein